MASPHDKTVLQAHSTFVSVFVLRSLTLPFDKRVWYRTVSSVRQLTVQIRCATIVPATSQQHHAHK